jgi:type III pantothenate kinase
MKLLLDIGNSSVNWAIEEQEQFVSTGDFAYDKNDFEKSLQENLSLTITPSAVLVSNVAGFEVFRSLNNWTKRKWHLKSWQPVVTSSFNELRNSYSDIQQMGLDRWLAMIAVWENKHSALCLVSCGTALTIDLINADGKHLGGYIIPGIELMQLALVSKTEQINVPIEYQATLDYANNTQMATNNGAFLATVAAIEHVVNKFSEESGSIPHCIISGGMAEMVMSLLNPAFKYEPNLVLSGLLIVYKASQ